MPNNNFYRLLGECPPLRLRQDGYLLFLAQHTNRFLGGGSILVHVPSVFKRQCARDSRAASGPSHAGKDGPGAESPTSRFSAMHRWRGDEARCRNVEFGSCLPLCPRSDIGFYCSSRILTLLESNRRAKKVPCFRPHSHIHSLRNGGPLIVSSTRPSDSINDDQSVHQFIKF